MRNNFAKDARNDASFGVEERACAVELLTMTAHAIPENWNFFGFEIVLLCTAHLSGLATSIE
jgi:hypothetical protein